MFVAPEAGFKVHCSQTRTPFLSRLPTPKGGQAFSGVFLKMSKFVRQAVSLASAARLAAKSRDR